MIKHSLIPTIEEADGTKTALFRLDEGKYEGTTFRYGACAFNDEDEDNVKLTFEFDVIDSPQGEPRAIEETEEFQKIVGDLLIAILEEQLIEDTSTEDE